MNRRDELDFARRTLADLRRQDAAKAKPPPRDEPRPATLANFWPTERKIWVDEETGEPEPEPIEYSPVLAAYQALRRW